MSKRLLFAVLGLLTIPIFIVIVELIESGQISESMKPIVILPTLLGMGAPWICALDASKKDKNMKWFWLVFLLSTPMAIIYLIKTRNFE